MTDVFDCSPASTAAVRTLSDGTVRVGRPVATARGPRPWPPLVTREISALVYAGSNGPSMKVVPGSGLPMM